LHKDVNFIFDNLLRQSLHHWRVCQISRLI